MRRGEPQWLDFVRVGADQGKVRAVPITPQGATQPVGFLVAGISPRLVFDDGYRGFPALVASQIGAAIAGAQVLEHAEARAAALAAHRPRQDRVLQQREPRVPHAAHA